jgi:hypothetical protein
MNCSRQLVEIGSVRKRVVQKNKTEIVRSSASEGNVSEAATLG